MKPKKLDFVVISNIYVSIILKPLLPKCQLMEKSLSVQWNLESLDELHYLIIFFSIQVSEALNQ